MKKKIIVVAAHPDDEALGCAGTIAKHVVQGDVVHSVFMSDGINSRLDSSKVKLKRRIKASKSVQSLLGISSTHYLNLPDNSMDTIPLLKIVQKLEPIIHKIKPSIIYTHSYCDLNIDHQLTHAAVMTACRPVPDSTVREIYGFEIISSTEWKAPQHLRFVPTLFVNITKFIKIKTQALKLYKEEMRSSPHSRSVKHAKVLAQHRGYTIGVNMAEAFEVYRIIS
jgi:LmbE family N-acetylglucosaminyl deacetylase